MTNAAALQIQQGEETVYRVLQRAGDVECVQKGACRYECDILPISTRDKWIHLMILTVTDNLTDGK